MSSSDLNSDTVCTTLFCLASFQSHILPPVTLRELTLPRRSPSTPFSISTVFFLFFCECASLLPRLTPPPVWFFFYSHLYFQFFSKLALSIWLLHLIKCLLPLFPILLQAWSSRSELHIGNPKLDDAWRQLLRHSNISVKYANKETWGCYRL